MWLSQQSKLKLVSKDSWTIALRPTTSNPSSSTGPVRMEKRALLLACIKRNAYLSNGPKETVDERAWILQEELLSRRLLTFKSHSVMWKCRTCYHMDGGSTSPQGWSSWLPLGHNNMKDQSTQSPGSLAGNKAPVRQQDFYEACG